MENENEYSHGKKKYIGALIIILSLLAVAGVFLYVKFGTKTNNAMGQKMPGGFPGGFGNQSQNVVSVKTVKAGKGELHDYVKSNGEIASQTSVDVFPDIGGKIVRVNVALGTRVYRGQILAYVDPSSPGEYYANSPVVSPITGTVTASPLRVGTKVTNGTAITTVGDVDNLQITLSIPERYVASLKVGLKADIILESYPDEIFAATVTRVSPLVDSVSRTKKVILNFDEKDSRIESGMFAKAKLWTDVYSDAITIPLDAVTENNNEKYVFIVKDDGTVEKRFVTTGKSVDSEVQILSGIEEGETVVVEGMRVLSEGASVKDITNGITTDFSTGGNPDENKKESGR